MDAKAERISKSRLDKTRQRRIRHFFLRQCKKAIRQDGLLLNLMPGSLWRASCPPPSGPLLRNVQIRSRRICPTQESVHRQTTDKTKGPAFRLSLSLLFDVWQFPTLAWGDPTLPSALRRFTSEFGMGSGGTTALLPPGKFCFIRPLLRSDLICIRLKIFSQFAKTPSAL